MAQPASTADGWSSLLSRVNPVPGFAEFTGPYKVGTVDVEIPVSELDSPAPAPEAADGIDTVQFRIFYPCEPDTKGKRITWLPAPQRDHLSAYIQFLGVSPLFAQAASFLPRHLHYTSIPAIKNAPILEPPASDDEQGTEDNNRRWPTAIFSHGLGGSRNAYSQIAGSLASHGIVVVCPEHRDGSAVVSYVRAPPTPSSSSTQQQQQQQGGRYFFSGSSAHRHRRIIPYRPIPHKPGPKVHQQRDDQLRVRLWELGLVFDAVLRIDNDGGSNFANLNTSTPAAALAQLAARMHVREPGSVVFAGHSFGASCIVQFVKSAFYAGRGGISSGVGALYAPRPDSPLCKQVTPRNVTILLDMWCFPLLSPATKALFDLPLPVYHVDGKADSSPPPGGAALLAVESTNFYEWTEHLHVTARVLSPDPSAARVSSDLFVLPSASSSSFEGSNNDGDDNGHHTTTTKTTVLPRPHFFYVERAAHLSQSDFGVLFPWFTSKVFGSEQPERVLRLNRRAALQVLRRNGIRVGRTAREDLVEGRGGDEKEEEEEVWKEGIEEDSAILEPRGEGDVRIEAWHWIDVVGLGEHTPTAAGDAEAEVEAAMETDDEVLAEKERAMAEVIDPVASVAEEGSGKGVAVAV
ncbi:platelet-activating factor acetylhydrolase, isoform II-domain-containing protein [Biscogniauxia sp. FL1348]|nr:platelet-activating factor acetylhydrolase, isoform II-domain-containing protein [Biscogniauxia sp. FL1348]